MMRRTPRTTRTDTLLPCTTHFRSLARRRNYSPVVTARLQDRMQRGHNALYRPAPPRWRRAMEFLLADFPRLVRVQRGCLWASATLFVVSTVAMYLAVRWRPELEIGRAHV